MSEIEIPHLVIIRIMSRRTIWVINKYASSAEDGFETRSMAISRKWVAAGHQVVMFCSNANHLTGNRPMTQPLEDRDIDGVRVLRLRTLRYVKTGSIRRVLSWFHFEWRMFRTSLVTLPKPDVIIVSSLSLLSVLSGMQLARKFGCPWVFEVRDIWPLTLQEEAGWSRRHPVVMAMGWLERRAYRNAALTVGTMPNLRQHVNEVVDADCTVACVPFGFDPEKAPPADLLCAGESAPSDGSGVMTIGYAGSIGVSNGLETLMACIVRLRHDARFRFIIAGDGDQRPTLMNLTRDCPNVRWLGRIPREEVHGVLSGCDLLYFAAHPSRVWTFGMSLNKLTDYLLAARPILGSYSGYPSILDEAGCGRFIPAEDADRLHEALLEFAALSTDERQRMGDAGRRWLFEHRTWRRIADDYSELLEGVIARHAPGMAGS